MDYLIKTWAAASLAPVGSIDIIPQVLSLRYHINYGAAFGIFQNKTTMLVIVNLIVIGGILYLILAKKLSNRLLNFAGALIVAGGIGNLIDRLFRVGGGVIDYIYFEPINFPIFNFADCCVTVGTALLIFYLLFLDGKKTQPKKEDAQ